MELIFALGRYFDGRDVFSKIPIALVMCLTTILVNPWLVFSTALEYTMGMGKFNSAYDGKGYKFKERTLYIFDFIPNFIAKYNEWAGGIVGYSLRYFLPYSPFLYYSFSPLLLLLSGPVYALGGILDRWNDARHPPEEKGIRVMGLGMPEFVCGALIGKVIFTIPYINFQFIIEFIKTLC